jgi:hypothetical protein
MRRVLARWQLSGLTLREFGEKRGIPLSTLSWWQRVFRRTGDEEGKGVAVENPVAFTEVPPPAKVPRTPAVVLRKIIRVWRAAHHEDNLLFAVG